MSIITNLDVMLAKRKMSLSTLSKKVGISIVNLSRLRGNEVSSEYAEAFVVVRQFWK